MSACIPDSNAATCVPFDVSDGSGVRTRWSGGGVEGGSGLRGGGGPWGGGGTARRLGVVVILPGPLHT